MIIGGVNMIKKWNKIYLFVLENMELILIVLIFDE